MAELRVRKLEEWVLNALKSRAKRNRHSLEAELRDTLRNDVMREKQSIVAEHEVMLKKLRDKYGTFSDGANLIREERDARG